MLCQNNLGKRNLISVINVDGTVQLTRKEVTTDCTWVLQTDPRTKIPSFWRRRLRLARLKETLLTKSNVTKKRGWSTRSNFMDLFPSSHVLKVTQLIQHYALGTGSSAVFRFTPKTFCYYTIIYLIQHKLLHR